MYSHIIDIVTLDLVILSSFVINDGLLNLLDHCQQVSIALPHLAVVKLYLNY